MEEYDLVVDNATQLVKNIGTQITDAVDSVKKEAKKLTLKGSDFKLSDLNGFAAEIAGEYVLSEANAAFQKSVTDIAEESTKIVSRWLKTDVSNVVGDVEKLRSYLNTTMSFIDYKNYEVCINTIKEYREALRDDLKVHFEIISIGDACSFATTDRRAFTLILKDYSDGKIKKLKDLDSYEGIYAFFTGTVLPKIMPSLNTAFSDDKDVLKEGGDIYNIYSDIFKQSVLDLIIVASSLSKDEIKKMYEDYNEFNKGLGKLSAKELEIATTIGFDTTVSETEKDYITTLKSDEYKKAVDFVSRGRNYIEKKTISQLITSKLRDILIKYSDNMHDRFEMIRNIDAYVKQLHETDSTQFSASFKLMDFQLEIFNKINDLMNKILINIETASVENKTSNIASMLDEASELYKQIKFNYDPSVNLKTSTAANTLIMKAFSAVLKISLVASTGMIIAIINSVADNVKSPTGDTLTLAEDTVKRFGNYIAGDDTEIESYISSVENCTKRFSIVTASKVDKLYSLASAGMSTAAVEEMAITMATTYSTVMSLITIPAALDVFMLSTTIEVTSGIIHGLEKVSATVKKLQAAFMSVGGGMAVEAIEALADPAVAKQYISNLEALALNATRDRLTYAMNKLFPSKSKSSTKEESAATKLTKIKAIYKNYKTILKECGVKI